MNGLRKLFLIQCAWALIGAALVAFAIWLMVRIINRHEPWAKRTAIVMALAVVVYPISLGPATALWSYCGEQRSWESPFFVVYFPIQMAMWRMEGLANALNRWYLEPCQSLGRKLNGNFPVSIPASNPDAAPESK